MPKFRSELMDRLSIQVFQARNLLVVAALVALVWFIVSGNSNKDLDRANESNTEEVVSDTPPANVSGIDIDKKSEELLSQSSESQKLQTLLEERLEELGEYYARELRGISPETPKWVLSTFEANGVDRDKIGLRHDGNDIKIGRWRTSETAPKFSGDTAFQEFFQNSLLAWKQSDQFGIQFKIYATKVTDKDIQASVVADIFGQVKLDRGRQATSLWQTNWTRGVNNELLLGSVSIKAQEEIVVDVAGGTLLQDCTESIMADCRCYNLQLKYGLDQWARQIPSLDIVGNQGLAIGDVNDDGLDDLYICQGHGLPNQLLVQNPNGTVSELTKLAGVDVLDESRGALIIDLDNDNDQDLAITTDDHVILFSNKGDGRFELERRLQIGFGGQSLAAADFDQDGDLDIFVCKDARPRDHADLKSVPTSYNQDREGGRNVLLRNDEGWNFTDVTESAGLTEHNSTRSRSAVWIDIDSDGDQDLFVANEWSSNRCYENQDGWFSDITNQLNLNRPGQNRTVSIGEFNEDGRPDLFVATDVTTAAYHLIQTNKKPNSELSPDNAAMLSLSHFWKSADPQSQSETGNSTQTGSRTKRTPQAAFTHYPLRVPIFTAETSFASAVADLNNDGLDDVLVSNGHLTRTSSEDLETFLLSHVANFDPEKISTYSEALSKSHDILDLVRTGFSLSANQRNRCYLSLGSLGFANFSAASGIDLLNDARAIATTDWDGDGDTDVVMTSRNGPQVRVFCNQMKSKNAYLQLNLEGTESNRDAIGARVEIYLANKPKPLVKFVTAGSGNLSQSTKRITFGLGDAEAIENAVVIWPNGKRQKFSGIVPNRQYKIVEGAASPAELSEGRFNLTIKPRQTRNNFSLPPLQRSVFYPPSALPTLSVQDASENWMRIKVQEEKPTLAIFCDDNGSSEDVLTMISGEKEAMDKADLDCMAVFVGNTARDDFDIQSEIRMANQLTDVTGFPFRWGAASEESIEKLQLLCGDWFSHQQLPQLPFAILLDQSDRVKAFYPTSTLDVDDVIKDKSLFKSTVNEPLEKRLGYNGKWISPYRYTDLGRLKDRFLELGFEEDANRLNSISSADLAKDLAMRAIELDSQHEFENSKTFFDRAIDVDPNCIIAYIGQGNLLRNVAAELELEKEGLKVEMLANAAVSFQYALDVDPFNVDAAIGKANVAIDQNRPSVAIDELKKYMEYNPQSAEMKAIMGRLLFARKEYREAATYLTDAFDMHPSLPFVAGDLGFLYLSAGEYKQALKFLRLAQRLQPSDKNVIRLLAEAELVSGNYEKAVNLFADVVRLHPNRVRPKNILAWLLATSPFEEHRNADRALEIIEPLIDLFGDTSAATLETNAAILAEQGNFEQAVDQQQKALDLLRKEVSTDQYSEEQKKGLMERLELYRRSRPYRSKDLDQVPFKKPGNRNSN